MCGYAAKSRRSCSCSSYNSGNDGFTIEQRKCKSFGHSLPEEFLKKLALANMTATAEGNRETITATVNGLRISLRSVSLLWIPGAAFLILEACLTAIASAVPLVHWGWCYGHHWLGSSTNKGGGGRVLNRREDRTQEPRASTLEEREGCASSVAGDDFPSGCIVDDGDNRRNATSRAFYQRSVRHGARRRGGLMHVLFFAVVAGIGAEAEGDGDEEAVLTVPLTLSGYQYTVGVTVSNTIYNATAALLLDTALHLIGFPSCEDSNYDSGNDLQCIPREVARLGVNSSYICDEISRDSGEVILQSDLLLSNQSVELVSPSSTTPRTDGSVFMISNQSVEGEITSYSTLQGWNSAEGVFGLAPYPESCYGKYPNSSVSSMILKDLPGDYEQMFALNLNDSDSESTLEIGGHTASSNLGWGDLLWGERHTAQYPSSWGFSAFDLSICGRGLMNNVTSLWPAIISTGSACLGLPQQMYDSLLAWLPCQGRDGQEECYASVDDLPWLSFRLSEHGKPLYIPIGSLVLNEGSLDEHLCLTRGDSIYIEDRFQMPSSQPMITLGTLPLRSLYTVLDAKSNRVGLAQKMYAGELLPSGNETCRASANCTGMQIFKESTNSCENPKCSAYFFTWLDEDTMTCRSSSNLILLAWSVGLVFGLTEIFGHFLSVYYGGKGVELRGQSHQHGWEFHTGRIIDACISKATRALGFSLRRHND